MKTLWLCITICQ